MASPRTSAMKMRCYYRRTVVSTCGRVRPEFHLRQWVTPSSTRLSLVTPFATQNLHFLSNGGIQLHRAMAGNYPRIPGIALGLGLVDSLSLPATHQLSLLNSRDGRNIRPGQATTERRATCPSSDGTTRDQDGSCSEDRRDCCSPWTTHMEGPTTRDEDGPIVTQNRPKVRPPALGRLPPDRRTASA